MKTELKNINSFDEILSDVTSLDTDTLIIIADQQIWNLYKKKLPLDQIKNKKIILRTTPSGEVVKSIDEYSSCMEYLLSKGVHRKSHLIALGGGSLSDFAGFVASTLLRGISWSVIPTTLLSMVDASIGGKTALNSKEGKNLIGAFHYPDNVWINTNFLESLEASEISNGHGEIIKYAFLDRDIYDCLSSETTDMKDIISKCSAYKLEITTKDFKEANTRKYLNLGHTFGHAIEKIYSKPHGESVYLGMALAFKLFGYDELIEELKKFSKHLNLKDKSFPWYKKTFPVDKIMSFIDKDKKLISRDSLDFVLIKKIGEPFFKNIRIDDLRKELEDKKESLSDFNL